jgi:hypothetical protein
MRSRPFRRRNKGMARFSGGGRSSHRILASIGELSTISSQLERSLLAMISNFIENENKYVSFLIFEKLQSNSKRIEFIDDLYKNIENHEFWPILKLNINFFFSERNKIVHGMVGKIENSNIDYVFVNPDKFYKKSELIMIDRVYIMQIIEYGKLLCAGSMCVLDPINGTQFCKTIFDADAIRKKILGGKN